MNRSRGVAAVVTAVRELYGMRASTRDPWADWLYDTHIFVVADYAQTYATRFGADGDCAAYAALLHDCADAVMRRTDAGHAEKSRALAREILARCGVSQEVVTVVCDDILPKHSCRDGILPESIEGKCMATADAVVHLTTDFYPEALRRMHAEGRDMAQAYRWMREKVHRDYTVKIQFDDVRASVEEYYRTRMNEAQRHETGCTDTTA